VPRRSPASLAEICQRHEYHLLESQVYPDNLRLAAQGGARSRRSPPRFKPSRRTLHANATGSWDWLRREWARGYLARSVGRVPLSIVKQYLHQQSAASRLRPAGEAADLSLPGRRACEFVGCARGLRVEPPSGLRYSLPPLVSTQVRERFCPEGTGDISRWWSLAEPPVRNCLCSPALKGRQTTSRPSPFQGWGDFHPQFRWFRQAPPPANVRRAFGTKSCVDTNALPPGRLWIGTWRDARRVLVDRSRRGSTLAGVSLCRNSRGMHHSLDQTLVERARIDWISEGL